jgi:hypothetical protein
MLLLERYISNFTCARYNFIYVEFSDFYVNQPLAGHTIPCFIPVNNSSQGVSLVFHELLQILYSISDFDIFLFILGKHNP